MSVSKRVAWSVYVVIFMLFGVAVAGTEVGSFTSPLSISLGGSGLTTTPTDGQLLIGKTSTNAYVLAVLTQNSANQVIVTNGSGAITLSLPQDVGTASNVTFGQILAQRKTLAKTANYSVVSGDSGTFFTNTGAAGTVNFTLPTAAAGLTYTFYVDAAQTLQVTAGASTTIRIGGSVSAAAGNVTDATLGGSVTLVGISTTQWVACAETGAWTVT